MLAIALGLASSVAIGTTDFLAGLKSRHVGAWTVVVVSQFSSVLVLLAVFAIAGDGMPAGADFYLFAAISALGQLAAVAAFWHGLTVGAMGVVAPITACGAIIPITIGFVSGDRPTAIQVLGVALAVTGVILASYEPVERTEARRPIAAGVGFALLAAVAIGIFYTGIAEASDRGGSLATAVSNRVISCSLLIIPAIAFRRHLSGTRRDMPALVAVGCLEVTGILLFAEATTGGLLVVIAAIGALNPLTTVGLARLVIGERLSRLQSVGAAAAIAGVAIVSASAAA
jgi:drug/metabolite transporter (DMT)-like permease